MPVPTKMMTLRLDAKLKKRLEKLAVSTRRSNSFLVTEAIREFVDLHEWQTEKIKKALVKADRGEFASEERVAKMYKAWGQHAR